MLAAVIVTSTNDSSGTSAMVMLPENSRNWPRTFEIIMWRAMKWTVECVGSMSQIPAAGTVRLSGVPAGRGWSR